VKNLIHPASVTTVLVLLVAGVGLGCAGEATDQTADEKAQMDASSTSLSPAVREMGIVALPDPRKEGPVSLEEAIQGRRSVREFTDEPLSLEELGQLLWATQGITSQQGGRAAPSAGGTYPLEVYVASGAVTGVPPGVYRYRPADHDLTSVTAGDVRASLQASGLDQQWIGDGAVDIIIAAVYERTTERYGERGVRYVHLEAGHAAQNLCLQAIALGLGAVTVGAFHDEEVQALLGMAPGEQPLYVIPVGRPVSR
jgi:SagB-type dehydrogenase family enzyme